MSGRLFNFHFSWFLLLLIFLNFTDLWSFTVVTWICLEYCWNVLFRIFLFFEGWRWGKWIYGTIKRFVGIKSMIKFWHQTWVAPCNTTLVTIICLSKSKWTINASFTYFRKVTLQLVKLYCLKPSKLWQTSDFSLTHSSLSQTVILFLLSLLSSLFFSFFWMYFFALLCFTSIFSFQTNPGLSFPPNLTHVGNDLRVHEPGFASLYCLYLWKVVLW